MAKQTLVYHITHIANLEGILQAGGLWCKAEQSRQQVTYQNIAHQNIQDRRATTLVPFGNGGLLHDYVPFYFAPRSPMLGAVHTGQVEGYDSGQASVLHLVSSVQRIQEAGLPFVFTDGHATVKFSAFFEDLKDLDRIDWALMKDRYWRDTPEDGDRKRRRQAEFLVHRFCPLGAFVGIGTCTEAIRSEVRQALDAFGLDLYTKVRRDWYY